jgi:hypothetical protein
MIIMDLSKLVKTINEVSAVNKALGGKDLGLDKASKTISDVSTIGSILDGSGPDLKEVAKAIVIDKVSEVVAENKVVKVISAFPGVGKTWMFNNQEELGIKVSDSDSSSFSWLSEGVRNPDFPANYVAHIKEAVNTSDVVLVSSHETVRDALVKAGIEFITVYPSIEDKEEYLKRFVERGSKEAFVGLINKNWDEWISNINKSNDGNLSIQLNLGAYLSDFVLNKHTDDSKLSFSISGKF